MATVRKNCRPAGFFAMPIRFCTFLPFCIHMAPALISEGAASLTGRAVDPSALGALLSWCLPRIRRSPCETKSAAIERERKGTVE